MEDFDKSLATYNEYRASLNQPPWPKEIGDLKFGEPITDEQMAIVAAWGHIEMLEEKCSTDTYPLSLEDKAEAEQIINCIFDYIEGKLPWLPGKNLILGASRKLCLNTIPYLFIFMGERCLELKLKK